MAALLNISACALHRQLKDEAASLQTLKDEVRFERAKDWLNRSDKPVKQVAVAAGFRNEKRFTRAFGNGPLQAHRISASARKTRWPAFRGL